VTHPLAVADGAPPVWSSTPAELLAGGLTVPASSKISLSDEGQTLRLESSEPDTGNQFVTQLIAVEKNTDYLLRIPVRVEAGNLIVSVTGTDRRQVYGSTPVLNPLETIRPAEKILGMYEIAFVSHDTEQVRIGLGSSGKRPLRTLAEVGRVKLYRLGPSSFLWTRSLRALIHVAQKFFLTAWMLPLALVGLVVLLLSGRGRACLILLAIPLYYLAFQSLLHTEYRYLLAMQPFLFVLVAVTLYALSLMTGQLMRSFVFFRRHNSRAGLKMEGASRS
jgi:hypothetical protein